MKHFSKLKTCVSLSIMCLALLSCSKEESPMDSQLKVSNATAITTNDLLGHWNLSGMVADVAVDLDDDKTSSTNLLDETDCFDTMSITFHEDGKFDASNSQMTFESGASNNEFSCLSGRSDSGEWEIIDNELVLTMEINAKTYIHRKPINLESNKFSFDVSKIESEQYVNDPGNTQASPITILELEYTKS